MANNKLVWHNRGEKYFEGGVSQVALYPMGTDGYETGVAWNGVTAINENPSGADITDLYADDEKYASLQAAEKFGFSIEAYQSPEEFDECDGSKEAAPGVYFGQQARKSFGLVYKTKIGSDTDPAMANAYKLHIIYNSLASPSGRQYQTINENPDAMSMSWDCNSTPEAVGEVNGTIYKSCSTITIDSRRIDSGKLKKLEAKLYGCDTADVDAGITAGPATLLTPAQVLAEIV